jgi:hypothetical protein
MELEPDKVAELESGKFYHFGFSQVPTFEEMDSFRSALRQNGVRAIITLGEVNVSDLCVLFQGMSPEDRELIRQSLGYVDPREHEQTK